MYPTFPLSGQTEIFDEATIVHPKDAHELTTALSANAEYLITINHNHFLSDNGRPPILPTIVCTPGVFSRNTLPGSPSPISDID
jgi:predicted nucleic acid-binding protein